MFETRFSFPFVAEKKCTQLFFLLLLLIESAKCLFKRVDLYYAINLFNMFHVSPSLSHDPLAQGVKSDISNNKKDRVFVLKFQSRLDMFFQPFARRNNAENELQREPRNAQRNENIL